MKKILLGLVATVMFSVMSFAQTKSTKSDFFGDIRKMDLKDVTSETSRRPIKIKISFEAGRWCFKDDPGCEGTIVLKTIPDQNGNYEITWDNIDDNFEMPNDKLYTPESTNSNYYVYIPKQTLKRDPKTKTIKAKVLIFTN
jgi:hypothetical protein